VSAPCAAPPTTRLVGLLSLGIAYESGIRVGVVGSGPWGFCSGPGFRGWCATRCCSELCATCLQEDPFS
jgi:hypothetical protein